MQEFLKLISKGLKNEIKKEDVFSKEIKVNHLKRIDKIFNKGLSFYLDPQEPIETKEASIFFRKKDFNSELNLQSKKIVNQFEEFKLSLSAIATLSDIDFKRTVPIFSTNDDARETAYKFRKILDPHFISNQKDFLKALINKLAQHNVLVLEFVETWNQKDRANIDGVFLNPNVIVLKRQEGFSFRREIFTLMHEFGHYLLNIEEIEKLNYDVLAKKNLSNVEQWCNDFSFYFLIGRYESEFNSLPNANPNNDYNHEVITNISANTHLSEVALFTRLLFSNKISQSNYNKIRQEANEKAIAYYEEMKRQRELDEEDGKKQKGRAPKPINSNLLISLVQTAYYEGIIDEFQVCKTLKIPPESIETYIE